MLICTLEFYPYLLKFLLLSPVLIFHLFEVVIDKTADCLSNLSSNKVFFFFYFVLRFHLFSNSYFAKKILKKENFVVFAGKLGQAQKAVEKESRKINPLIFKFIFQIK